MKLTKGILEDPTSHYAYGFTFQHDGVKWLMNYGESFRDSKLLFKVLCYGDDGLWLLRMFGLVFYMTPDFSGCDVSIKFEIWHRFLLTTILNIAKKNGLAITETDKMMISFLISSNLYSQVYFHRSLSTHVNQNKSGHPMTTDTNSLVNVTVSHIFITKFYDIIEKENKRVEDFKDLDECENYLKGHAVVIANEIEKEIGIKFKSEKLNVNRIEKNSKDHYILNKGNTFLGYSIRFDDDYAQFLPYNNNLRKALGALLSVRYDKNSTSNVVGGSNFQISLAMCIALGVAISYVNKDLYRICAFVYNHYRELGYKPQLFNADDVDAYNNVAKIYLDIFRNTKKCPPFPQYEWILHLYNTEISIPDVDEDDDTKSVASDVPMINFNPFAPLNDEEDTLINSVLGLESRIKVGPPVILDAMGEPDEAKIGEMKPDIEARARKDAVHKEKLRNWAIQAAKRKEERRKDRRRRIIELENDDVSFASREIPGQEDLDLIARLERGEKLQEQEEKRAQEWLDILARRDEISPRSTFSYDGEDYEENHEEYEVKDPFTIADLDEAWAENPELATSDVGHKAIEYINRKRSTRSHYSIGEAYKDAYEFIRREAERY